MKSECCSHGLIGLKQYLTKRGNLIADQQNVIEQKDEELTKRGKQIVEQLDTIKQKDELLALRGKQITDQQNVIEQKDAELAQKQAANEALNSQLNQILNSKIWRWSAPLRKAAEKIRRSLPDRG